jgi:hypothetical protein
LVPGERVYFLRPAARENPAESCFVFYGAHLFRYWLIVENELTIPKQYSVRLAGDGDEFSVLSTSAKGNFDIAQTGCTARGCDTTISRFDGSRYQPVRCRRMTFLESGKQVEQRVKCGE